MKDKKEFQLLKDLAELFEKHGSESFESLARLFSDEKFSENISTILMGIYDKSNDINDKANKQPANTKSIRSSILDLKVVNPEQSAVLLDIYDKLKEKKYLPKFSQVRSFCEDNDLKPITVKSRKSAVHQLIKYLMDLSLNDIYKIQNMLEETPQERTLDGWSSIILNKRANEVHNPSLKTDK